MPLNATQAAFLTRYLGLDLGARASGDGPAGSATLRAPVETGWRVARQAWLDANDSLDTQLNALRRAVLAEADHPELAAELKQIAEVGLNALTGNHRVRLMAALQGLGDGAAASLQQHGGKALEAISGFRAYLDGNEMVDACEGNPWDVEVAIRGTLYPPLDRLVDILKQH